MSKREKLIRQALDAAVAKGIKIWPGAAFDWTDRPPGVTFKKFKVPGPSGPLPSACNAIGAMELVLGRERKFTDGWFTKVCVHLGVGSYWLYRFHMGFDRGQQLVYKVKDSNDKLVDKQCDVSKLGLKLRKRYVGW